jgi:ABC-type branched-subunit amino acid transport system ATPase component
MLEVKDLDSWYGEVQVLKKVSIHINKGEVVTIIGPNGSGKSTLLKCIFGLIKKRKGSVTFEGKPIIGKKTNEITKLGVCFVPQGRSVFPSLTVKENLEIGAFIRHDDFDNDLEMVYRMFPILKKRRHQRSGLLSGGEQQMVSIGRALMLKPKLLLLDEPSLGLAPKIKMQIFEKIIEINKKFGTAILVVEQNARLALSLSNRAYVLELGEKKLEGSGKKLLKDKRVHKLYLGGL